jgi:DNA-binding transcriptional regulator YiaG
MTKIKTTMITSTDLKTRRKKLKKKQEDVARRMRVSVRTIARWEGGEAIPEAMQALLLYVLADLEGRVTIAEESTAA